MAAESGGSRAVAAVVLGVAFVIGAWIVGTAMDRQAVQIGAVAGALGELDDAIRAGGGAPGRPRAEGPGMPDPGERYTVDVGSAPIRGEQGRQDHDRRVQRLPVSVLQSRESDAAATPPDLPRQGAPRVQAHAAGHARRRTGRARRRRSRPSPGQVLGDARQDVRQPARTEAREVPRIRRELGLDLAQFEKDVASPDVEKRIDTDSKEASKLGVSGTPAFFINGKFLSGAQPIEAFKKMIDEELAKG